MYPQDNIFNIFYNIGRRLPFIVKRIHGGAQIQIISTTSREGLFW